MSKNYQIKYSITAKDLTRVGVKSAIDNLKKLAKLQNDTSGKYIAYSARLAKGQATANKSQKEAISLSKQENKLLADKVRYAQLLGRQVVMDKAKQLRMLKGDIGGLEKYIRTQSGLLTKLQNKTFDKTDYKNKADNLGKQLAIQGRINRAEVMHGQAIEANNRRIIARTRELARQERIRARDVRNAQIERRNQIISMGAVGGATLYAGKGFAEKSLENAMSLEQMGISTRAFFGSEAGQKILLSSMDYAKRTAFSPQDTYKLAMGLKAASGTGVVSFSENPELMAKQVSQMVEQIGRPILAYANGEEGRQEIARQFFQAMSRGYLEIRKDMDVMKSHGLFAIQPELEKILGKSVNDMGDEKVSSKILLQAYLNLSKSEGVDSAMQARVNSLSQAYDGLGEQVKFTWGSLGLLIARSTGLPPLFNKISNELTDLQGKFDGNNKKMDMSGRESLTLAQRLTVAGIAVGGLTAGILALAGAWKLFMVAGGSVSFLVTALSYASAIYLAFADWKGLIEDLGKEDKWSAIKKHLDIVLAGLLGVAGVFGLLATGNIIGAAALAATIIGAGIYGIDSAKKQIQEDKSNQMNAMLSKTRTGNYNDPAQQFFNAAMPQQNMTPIPANISVNNIINVDPVKGTSKTKTEIRSPYSNPIFYQGFATKGAM